MNTRISPHKWESIRNWLAILLLLSIGIVWPPSHADSSPSLDISRIAHE